MHKNYNVDFVETKNAEIRKVPMNKQLTAILKNVKGTGQLSGYVFSEDGKQPYGDVKRAWWKALKETGIDGFRFHDLRHTFESRLGMAGGEVSVIIEWAISSVG